MTGLDEAEGRITAVRNKFERQLQRLRERERLVEVSRQDCQKEEEALQADRARHREQMEQVLCGRLISCVVTNATVVFVGDLVNLGLPSKEGAYSSVSLGGEKKTRFASGKRCVRQHGGTVPLFVCTSYSPES